MFLQHNFDGLYCVENVVPYYQPLMEPRVMGRHTYWSNFDWPDMEAPELPIDFINDQNLNAKEKLMAWHNIHYDKNVYYEGNHCPTQILRNAVHYSVGQHIYEHARQTYDALRATP